MYPLRYRCFWPDIRKNASCCWRLKKVNKKSNFLSMTSALKLNLLQPLRCFFFVFYLSFVIFKLHFSRLITLTALPDIPPSWRVFLAHALEYTIAWQLRRQQTHLFFFLWAFHFYQNMKKGGRQTIYHSRLTTSTTFQVQQQESKSPTAQRPALSKSPHTHETTPRWK